MQGYPYSIRRNRIYTAVDCGPEATTAVRVTVSYDRAGVIRHKTSIRAV